jgi:hypothetical protein
VVLLLLAGGPAAAAEAPEVCVDLRFDVGRRSIGTFSLWSASTGPVRPRAADEPRHPAEEVPAAYVQVGPLLDEGDLPFRAWSAVTFTHPLFRLLSGDVGVGLIPTLFLDPHVAAGGEVVGVNGTVSLEGGLTLSLGRTSETVPLRWQRGIEALLPAAGVHAVSAEGVVDVEAGGQYLAYRWRFRGTIRYDIHVYASPPE